MRSLGTIIRKYLSENIFLIIVFKGIQQLKAYLGKSVYVLPKISHFFSHKVMFNTTKKSFLSTFCKYTIPIHAECHTTMPFL